MSEINTQLMQPQNRVIRGLIVDDEPVIHASISLIFEDVEWISAMTAAEGLAHAGDTTFDVALVDKNLPDGNGISVARHLKEQDPHLSVVIVTGYPSMDSAIEAVRVAAFDYLPKPFQMAEAELKIRNAIEHSCLQRQQQSLLGALTESEELHRGLIEASPDAIFMLDAVSNTILSANAAAAKLYGYTRAELVGLAATKLNQSADGIPQAAIGTRDECKLDGSAITVDASRALANMNGRDVIIEIVRDLTERRRQEQEEQRSSRMKMLGQLSGGVVHDLNNLLMVQAHCVDVFEEYFGEVTQTEETKEILEDVEALRTVTTHTSRLGRQLMTFAGQNRHGHAEGLNLNDVIEKMQRVLSRSLGEHIAIEITPAPDLRSVFADPGQMEQVILNLAVNARDAMAGGGTLGITTRNARSCTGDHEVELEVRDTGTGIDPEVLPMIFQPLFSTKGPERGTGLGLATVQRIIHNAEGRLDVSSTVGLGTRVVAHIPARDQSGARGKQPDEANVKTLVGRGELILVVEDDDGVRRAVQKMLVRSGFAVVGAHNGTRALELLRTTEQEVALTLADVLMPVMSGGHLQERLQALYSEPKIILMSGQDLNQSEDVVFLQKPFTEQELARVVRRALDDDGSANDQEGCRQQKRKCGVSENMPSRHRLSVMACTIALGVGMLACGPTPRSSDSSANTTPDPELAIGSEESPPDALSTNGDETSPANNQSEPPERQPAATAGGQTGQGSNAVSSKLRSAIQGHKASLASCNRQQRSATPTASAARCACRVVCSMRLPKLTGHTRVSYPLTGADTGFFFEIAVDGQPTSCGYPDVMAELSCATAVPSAQALSSSQIEDLDPASSVVVLPDLRIEGIRNSLYHAHGGRAADLFDASFQVKVASRAKAVRIKKAWLVGAHCMADRWSTATPLKINKVSGIKPQAPVQSAIRLKANSTTEIHFSFDRQEVYNACDYFAVRTRLQVDKENVEFEIPLEVTRFDVDDFAP